MKIHPQPDWVHLQIKDSGLHRLLFMASQLGQAIGKGIGDSELYVFATCPQC